MSLRITVVFSIVVKTSKKDVTFEEFLQHMLQDFKVCLTILRHKGLRMQWRLIFANVLRLSRIRLWIVYFIYFKTFFFNICVLSQCIVYWIHFENIHTFTYKKTLLHTLFCLVLNSSKVFSGSLRLSIWKQPLELFCKKKVPKNLSNFTEKYLFWNYLFSNRL